MDDMKGHKGPTSPPDLPDVPGQETRSGATSRQPRRFSYRTIAPNLVTLLAFACGFTAINYAVREMWFFGVSVILLAGVLDGLDGAVARLLRSTSKFGAELDSLSDIVAFGVAPAVLMYLWSLDGLDRMGWAAATIYAVAMALRLARFNSRLDSEDDLRKRHGYLTGVPAPAGAGLAIVPILIDDLIDGFRLQAMPEVIAVYIVLISCLMISTLPTLSLKNVHIPRAFFTPLMLVFAGILGMLFINPSLTLTVVAAGYFVSLPLCFIGFQRRISRKK